MNTSPPEAEDILQGEDMSSEQGVVIDARHTNGPIPLVKLKSELKPLPFGAIVTVLTTDNNAERNLRSFCRSTCNQYLGCDFVDEHQVHRIKKAHEKMECETCRNIRTAVFGIVTLCALSYTGAVALKGDPSFFETLVFVLSLVAFPPVATDNIRLLIRTIKGPESKAETDEV